MIRMQGDGFGVKVRVPVSIGVKFKVKGHGWCGVMVTLGSVQYRDALMPRGPNTNDQAKFLFPTN